MLYDHPYVRNVLILDKRNHKYRNIRYMIRYVRSEKYDYVINAQRFFVTGLITVLSGAKYTIGFDKNPLSFLFSERKVHKISATGDGKHEVERNQSLIEKLTDSNPARPKLYPTKGDFQKVAKTEEYVCMAPASVWFTKQFPKEKWIELINKIPNHYVIYLMGSLADVALCEEIKLADSSKNVEVLAGKLTFLESAALMKNAKMNFVNDSAPLHFASAMNAPVTAFFCSTIPAFGFGPLSDVSLIAEIDHDLYCRPCGLHGYKKCPEGHFKCSKIDTNPVVRILYQNEKGPL